MMSEVEPLQPTVGEAALMAPLVQWLRNRRQIRESTLLIEEFPWHGRRVDLATITASGITASYELKLAHNRRAIEQSYLNGVAFDRSYLVTATRPSAGNLAQARALGLGVILVSPTTGSIELFLTPKRASVHPKMRAKLRSALARRGGNTGV